MTYISAVLCVCPYFWPVQILCAMRLRLVHFRQLVRPFLLRLDLRRPPDDLDDYDARLRLIMRRHLGALGSWSLLNLLAGVAGMLWLDGFWYYFVMMGFVWGLINFAIALLLFKFHFLNKFRGGDVLQRIEAQHHVEKMLLLNLGLDLCYTFIGCWIREHGLHLTQDAELWLGFGAAVIVQGVYLFVHDLSFFRLHRRNFHLAEPVLRRQLARSDAR